MSREPVVQSMNLYFSQMLSSFLDQQITHQIHQLHLIEHKIQEYDTEFRGEETESSEEKESVATDAHLSYQERSIEGKKKCGRPVTDSVLEQRVKEIVKYLENRGL